jgi:aldose 1-epimerase
MPPRPDRLVRLAVGDVELVIDLDDGARATQWRVRGLSLLSDHGPDAVEHGMYPMAPWAGRIRDNRVEWNGGSHELPVTYGSWAIHGTALRERASLVELSQADDHARLVVRVIDHPGWPWPMAVDIAWDVRGRTITTTIEVHALAEPFPVVVGWHPWFRRQLEAGDPAEWTLEATDRLERGADHLPTGRLLPFDPDDGPFDDAFLVPSGRAGIRWPDALGMDIESDGRWYVVFDQLPGSVCVEPQSGPPDGLGGAVDSEPAVAAPGTPHRMVTTWTVRDLA